MHLREVEDMAGILSAMANPVGLEVLPLIVGSERSVGEIANYERDGRGLRTAGLASGSGLGRRRA
ncbi:hypothetical protein [Rhizobium ruizarguesonis]|uniref:hypothetical protein n=1 Tax=Rhizobium ruizarguesonis TaxID=2081791 RepID=UPI00385718F9